MTIGKQEVREFLRMNSAQYSQEDLSKLLEQPISAISVALAEMQKEGTVTVTEGPGRKGTKHTVNLYSFNSPDPGMQEVLKDFKNARNAFPVLRDWPPEAVLTAMLIVEIRKGGQKP